MKSLLLVFAASVVYLAVITEIFQAWPVRRRAAVMACLFLLTLPFFVAVHMLTPPDLGFLPPGMTESSRWVDLGFGLFVYAAAFFGGILQLYNLSDRGFSLRILIEIDESPTGVMTPEEITRGYSRGRGLDWVFQKRIDGLVAQGWILVQEGIVQSTDAGRRMGAVFRWVKTFLRIDSGA